MYKCVRAATFCSLKYIGGFIGRLELHAVVNVLLYRAEAKITFISEVNWQYYVSNGACIYTEEIYL